MKQVYIASDAMMANLLVTMLHSKGYFAVIRDERLSNLRPGNVAVYPTVWVHDEDFDEARKIAIEFDAQSTGKTSKPSWTCPKCGEMLDGSFEECWKCAQ
jgi:hypothetical protein